VLLFHLNTLNETNNNRQDSPGRVIGPSQSKGKGKAVPLQAWTGPEGFKDVKFPRFRNNGTGLW